MRTSFPAPYWYMFIWFEGFMMTAGAVQAIVAPRALLELSMPNIDYADPLGPLLFQMAGSWLVLVWMRVMMAVFYPTNLAVWRHLIGASLVSDCFYLTGNVMDLGLARFLNPARWSSGDALTILTTIPPLVAKVFFLAGVGLHNQRAAAVRLDKEPTSSAPTSTAKRAH